MNQETENRTEEKAAATETAGENTAAAAEDPPAVESENGAAPENGQEAPEDEGSNEEKKEETVEVSASEWERLKAESEEHYQRFLRVQADFDNFRRRTRLEKEEFAKYASQQIIESLLPIIDNFERAVAVSREQSDYDSLAKGVDMIHRQLLQLLENEGLKAIEAVGQPFNPEYHEAVMQVSAEEGVESGTVIEELQKGYILKERVLRPSMVKVAE
mgnify:CR=1 FL=1